MRINTFIVILLITFIICNNNNHIKGKEKDNKKRLLAVACKTALVARTAIYQEITGITIKTDKSFVNLDYIVYVDMSSSDHKYSYHSYTNPQDVADVTGRFTFTTIAKLDYILKAEVISAVHNYEFPWTKGSTPLPNTFSFGSVDGDKYAADCTTSSGVRMINLLAAPDVATVAKYEKMDQYKDTFDEKRNAIGDDDIGEGVMLSRVDAAAPNRNYNIFLSKTKFCHFSCKIDNTECDLLVYETANYKSQNINDAFIIGLTPKAKYYKEVKADTVELVDTCAGDGTKGDECTMPQYTVISKGTGKILTGYYKDEIKKYLVSTSPPKMPADIYAKFPTYIYCLGEPGVQGVSNMFINSILLILIVILMI